MKAFITGVVVTLSVLVAGAYLSVINGWIPANADATPCALETWVAHKSLRATIQHQMPTAPAPVALNDSNLIKGIHLYTTNCAVCHGSSNGEPSNIASGLFQPAPQLARHGVTDDPEGKIYWFIKHGVRFTGMPAFSGALSEEQIWQITLFLKNMDSLPSAVDKVWKATPSSKIN